MWSGLDTHRAERLLLTHLSQKRGTDLLVWVPWEEPGAGLQLSGFWGCMWGRAIQVQG